MKAKLITGAVILLILTSLIILSGCYIKKYAAAKVDNEMLIIKLNNAQSEVKELQKSFEALQQVEKTTDKIDVKTDTIYLKSYETNEIVKESKTTLDDILQKINKVQSDINQIKTILYEKN